MARKQQKKTTRQHQCRRIRFTFM